jgi:hypothetical protein
MLDKSGSGPETRRSISDPVEIVRAKKEIPKPMRRYERWSRRNIWKRRKNLKSPPSLLPPSSLPPPSSLVPLPSSLLLTTCPISNVYSGYFLKWNTIIKGVGLPSSLLLPPPPSSLPPPHHLPHKKFPVDSGK